MTKNVSQICLGHNFYPIYLTVFVCNTVIKSPQRKTKIYMVGYVGKLSPFSLFALYASSYSPSRRGLFMYIIQTARAKKTFC